MLQYNIRLVPTLNSAAYHENKWGSRDIAPGILNLVAI
jgi:hypothetical protein